MHEQYYKNMPSNIKSLFRGRLEPEREEAGRRQSYFDPGSPVKYKETQSPFTEMCFKALWSESIKVFLLGNKS